MATETQQPQVATKNGYRAYALHLWTIFGLALSNFFLIVAAALALPRSRWRWLRLQRSLWVPLALYTLFLCVSVALSVEPQASRPELREIFSLATVPLALLWVRRERDLRRLVDGMIVVASLTAIHGLTQLARGYGELGHRIVGPFSHYMTFSGILLMADLALIGLLVGGAAGRRWWRWVALLLINLALVGTLTRSAWVALLIVLAVLAVLKTPKVLWVSLPVLAVLLLAAPEAVRQRFVSIFDLHDVTNYDRICMVEAGLQMVADRPLFGLGPEAVRHRYPIYRQPTAPQSNVTHLHNTYVHLAAERGLASLAALLWLFGASLAVSLRGLRAGEKGARAPDLQLAAFLAVLGFAVAGLFESNWRDTELQRWVLFFISVPYLPVLSRGGASAPAVKE